MPPKLPGILRPLEEKLGLPPLRELTEVFSSDNGKRMDAILSKLIKLSSNQGAFSQATELLKVVQDLGRTGDLERLDSILKSLPKGKSGQAMLTEVKNLINDLDKKLDKVSNLAQSILSREE